MTQSWCAVVIGVSALALVCATQLAAAAGCRDDSNCPDDQMCIKKKVCVNICQINSVCGNNSYCTSSNHDFTCRCLNGYVPDPNRQTGCILSKPSGGSQVVDDSVSQGNCRGYCGVNAVCKLYGKVPLCGCRPGFLGNPYDKNSGCHRVAEGQVDSAACWGQDRDDLSVDCLKYLKYRPRKQFSIMKDPASWFEAHKLCEVENKMLAIIENRYDQEALETQLIEEGVEGTLWIAGSDLKVPGRFQWVSGNTFNQMIYSNWHRQEPSRKHHCVAVLERFDWGSRSCQEERYFVCQNK